MGEFDQLQVERRNGQAVAGSAPRLKEGAPHDLLRLQRLAGNDAVSSLLVQRDLMGAPAPGRQPNVSLSKPGEILVTLVDGEVIDASAKVG